MKRVILLCALCLVPSLGAAQMTGPLGGRVRITTGLSRLDRRDGNASPVRYGGLGQLLELGYERRGARWTLGVRAGYAAGRLTSDLTAGDVPRQTDERLWLDAELLKGDRWQVGLLARGEAAGWTHVYGGPSGQSVSFAQSSVALAPAVGWQRWGPRRGVAVRLAIPVVAVVERPYGDERVASFGSRPARFETLATYQAFDLRGSLRWLVSRRADLLVEYRLAVQRYDRPTVLNTSRHTLTLGLGWGFGRAE